MSDMVVPDGQTSDEVYDKQHGTPGPGPEAGMTEDELLGTKLNPVRDVAPPFTGLGDGGTPRE